MSGHDDLPAAALVLGEIGSAGDGNVDVDGNDGGNNDVDGNSSGAP
ncbi:MAG TPA: hypothetical protein VIR00_15375 [Micromonosporaceae bacterium]|jgi:hypothetical protein